MRGTAPIVAGMRAPGLTPALLLSLGLLTAACGGGDTDTAAISPSPSPSTSPSPSPSPAAIPVDPLTGLAPKPTTPVVVVKVDNASIARPFQRGLDKAAIVYEELVESGETRLAAVYSAPVGVEVGPVRSVRDSDIELLRQFGKVSVAFSGGNTGVKASFDKAVRAGQLLDASFDVVPQDYRLGERRVDARNFFTVPSKLALSRPGSAAADIGLRFGPLPVSAGAPAATARVVFSPFVTVGLTYDPATQAWAIAQNTRRMPTVAPQNVIVQQVAVKPGKYVDVKGNASPYTVTTGSGKATVFRDGRAIPATWRRLTTATGTRYLDAQGKDIPLHPGATWVLLQPKGQALTTG